MMHREPRRHARSAFYQFWRQCAAAAMIGLTGVRHFDVPALRRLGGVLIASNHQSFLDPMLLGMAFGRPVHYLARDDLFRIPGLGWLIRGVNTHPVKRGGRDGAAVRTVMRIVAGGDALVVFPEGTRSWDGSLGRFHQGVGAIALRCRVPVVPACIEGAFRCWPRTRALPRPARVAVAFGEPLWPEGRDRRLLTDELRDRIADLQRFLRRYLAQVDCD